VEYISYITVEYISCLFSIYLQGEANSKLFHGIKNTFLEKK